MSLTKKMKVVKERFRKEVCLRSLEIDPDDEIDWRDLSMGFFLACGLTIEQANVLASDVRYNEHYWT